MSRNVEDVQDVQGCQGISGDIQGCPGMSGTREIIIGPRINAKDFNLKLLVRYVTLKNGYRSTEDFFLSKMTPKTVKKLLDRIPKSRI